jgi:hypothetical protein
MGGFGTVEQSSSPELTPEQQQHLDQAAEVINENDPRLVSEAIEMNESGDAYMQPAPVPDGIYRVKLKIMQIEDNGTKKDYKLALTKGKQGALRLPYYSTQLEATIISVGPYENLRVFDSWVSTSRGRDNSSKIATILQKLRKADGSPYILPGSTNGWNQKHWLDLYLQALATEPECGIETQWEWSCEACGKEAKETGGDYPRSITGMAKFQLDEEKTKANKGVKVYSPELRCQLNPAHQYSKARPRIARVLSLDELAHALKARA